MSEIKLTASFTLPGRVIEGSDSYQKESLEVYDLNSKKRQTIKYSVRIPIEAEQRLNISEETYDHWINTKTKEYTSHQWSKTEDKYKIMSHLKEVQQALGATSFKFHIFD